MINMLTGDIPTAYKYLLDIVHYSKGDVKVQAQELSEQIKMRSDRIDRNPGRAHPEG